MMAGGVIAYRCTHIDKAELLDQRLITWFAGTQTMERDKHKASNVRRIKQNDVGFRE